MIKTNVIGANNHPISGTHEKNCNTPTKANWAPIYLTKLSFFSTSRRIKPIMGKQAKIAIVLFASLNFISSNVKTFLAFFSSAINKYIKNLYSSSIVSVYSLCKSSHYGYLYTLREEGYTMIIKFTSKTMGDVLTEKQELVLKIIRNWYLENGEAPSLSELQESLSISTKRGVVNHLIALEKKGYIFRTSKPRGIHMVDSDDEVVYDYLVGIPVLGYANAGTPLVSAEEENIGVLKIDRSLVGKKKNLFSLIVKGDSMNLASIEDKCIEEGNYVIVQKDSEINDGDIVVAIIENSATVKRIKKAKDMIVLYPQSSNPENQPIFLDKDTESIINGKVIKVLENPSI